MATKKSTKKEIRGYAEDRFFEVFGQLDDFEQEYRMMGEELASCKTQKAVDECLEILLEVYQNYMEEWSPIPKALEE
jgi:hypothetical protein